MRQIRILAPVLLLLLFLAACASRPAIIRQMFPLVNTNAAVITNKASLNDSFLEKDGLTLSIHFMDRSELFDLLRKNKMQGQGSGGTDPVVTTFLLSVRNDRMQKIKVDWDSIVLLDGMGRQLPLLGLDAFKEMYPVSYERTTAYFFLFDKYINEPGKPLSAKAKKSLFQGGYVYGTARVEGILTFDRISQIARQVSVIIPEVTYYDADDKPIKKEDFRFDFIQSIIRLEG